jgi:Zn finger protein HypA/HybF involved in hydrogenase expression
MRVLSPRCRKCKARITPQAARLNRRLCDGCISREIRVIAREMRRDDPAR